MKPSYNTFLHIILLTVMFTLPAPAGATEESAPTRAAYVIGDGDVLEISVWKDQALSKVVAVLPDGRISFPLLGEIMASGKTVAQLTEELSTKISAYVSDPSLSVGVQQVNSMAIYVIGKVNKSGRFPLTTDINVLQALSMAGGVTPFAKRNQIRILREEWGQTQTFYFHYDDVSEGDDLKKNIVLKRGDVVVVP